MNIPVIHAMRLPGAAIILLLVSLLSACGGGGSSPAPQTTTPATTTGGSSPGTSTPSSSGANVLPLVVESGPYSGANTLFASVTVCAPGGSQCQVIDHVLVDSGSIGLRIFSSALPASLAQVYRQQSAGTSTVGECTQFADGYTWGAVRQAAVRLAGKSLDNVAIQVIGDSQFADVPVDCSSTGPSLNTPSSFGANGVLGVGVFEQDCGAVCAQTSTAGVYYSCSASSCQPVAVPVAQQVQNPVALFTTDNNGVAISLPAIPASGTASAAGSLVFGIGTQANNAVAANATVLTLDPSTGYFTALYKGRTLRRSFIDSGSNAYFFDDASIPVCSTGFFCPSGTLSSSATNQGRNGVTNTVTFRVANADALFSNNFAAFDALAGPNGDTGSFDWGLPFFYGRTVFTAIENRSTPRGTGPYFAY